MSRRSRKSTIDGPWAAVTIEMLESPAYRAMTLSALRIIARLQIELANQGGKGNGRLIVTYEQFQCYGIDRHSISPAIQLASALGFLEVTERGRAGNAEFRTPSRYRLTFRDADGGYAGTNEWRSIDEERVQAIVRVVRASVKKLKVRCGNLPDFGAEIPHRKRVIYGGKTPTTTLNGETPTTLYIPRGEDAA